MSPEEIAHAGAVETAPRSGDSGRHLSPIRVIGLALAVIAAAVGIWFSVQSGGTPVAVAASRTWFSPYVDVTATPQYAFENRSGGTAPTAVLGFVVSGTAVGADPCLPTWGGAYSLPAAADSLDLDRRVARLEQLGGAVTVSFGGAANSELSVRCTDVTRLTAAYRSVLDRYSATTIDLDIEGSASSAPAVTARRAAAIAALTQAATAAGHPLQVWLTLPVGPSGLAAEGLGQLQAMLAAHVELAGVNAMTMDYGVPLGDQSMADEGELALSALQPQLRSAYASAGNPLTAAQSWQHIGATAMIGQNDVAGEVFTLADARQLVGFAIVHDLQRLSMWSANRDQGCGPNYPDVQVVSDACSGVTQSAGEFGTTFATFGAAATAPSGSGSASATTTAVTSATTAATGVTDNPATSPYPIWNQAAAYPKNGKIVWHHNVYQAKWYTVGDLPDAPVPNSSLTPWTLIGPVLPGEHPAVTPTLPAGTYPVWSAAASYPGGSRVLQNGVGYQAKWWTKGDRPGDEVMTSTGTSPWQLIGSR